METVTLPGGIPMPILGLGTWRCPDGADFRQAMEAALDAGYRLIDTAMAYNNEHVVGEVLNKYIKEGRIKREEVFLVTKLWSIYMGSRDAVRRGFQRSLSALQLDYVDLLLLHTPMGMKLREDESFLPRDQHGKVEVEHHDLLETWKAMEEFVDEGRVRTLGLSNFNSHQVSLLSRSARVPVSNLQVECHAYFPQVALCEFCWQLKISVTAYAPLGSPARPAHYKTDPSYPVLLEDPVVLGIAKRHGKSPAQVLLRNLVQRGVCVIPRSLTPNRVRENIQIFDFHLDEVDMAAIAALDRKTRMFPLDHFPEWKQHPEYPFHIEF